MTIPGAFILGFIAGSLVIVLTGSAYLSYCDKQKEAREEMNEIKMNIKALTEQMVSVMGKDVGRK